MSWTKSTSPLISAWTIGSSALNTRKTTSSTCGSPAPVVRVLLEAVESTPPALPSTSRNGPGADDRLAVGRLGGVGRHLLLADVLPDVLGDDRDRQQRQHRVGLLQLQHHGGVVGSGDRLDVGQVGPVERALAVPGEDPVVGVGDVGGGERLAVGPLHALADVEGPRQAVLGGLPGLGQRRHGRHVVHRVADHVVVGQRPRLVGRRLDSRGTG